MNMRSVINAILIIAVTFMLGSYLKLAVVFSTDSFLNMIMISFIVGIAYLFLLFICGLFPTEKMADTLRSK